MDGEATRMSSESINRFSRALASGAVAGIVLAIFFVSNGAANSLLGFGVAGVATTFLVNRWSARNLALSSIMGAGVAWMYFGTHHRYIPCAVSAIMLPMAFLGLGSLVVMVWQSWHDADALSFQICGSFIPLFALV